MKKKYDYSPQVRIACKAVGIPMPEAEFVFAAPRRFRFDFAWPPTERQDGVALEVDGGTWVQGRHSRGEADHEKFNIAAKNSWLIFRTTPKKVGNLEIYRMIKEAL